MTAPPMMSLATVPGRRGSVPPAGRDGTAELAQMGNRVQGGRERFGENQTTPAGALDSREHGALRCLLQPTISIGVSMRQRRLAVAVMPLENRREALMGVAEAADQ